MAEFKMLVLNHAGIRHLGIRVVEHRIALEILHPLHQLMVEADGTEFQLSEPVAEPGIQRPGIQHTVGHGKIFLLFCQKILAQTHLNALKQPLEQLRIAADGNTLVRVVEIVVVKGETHRQTAQHKCRNLLRRHPPLLFGVALDQLFINVTSAQLHALLLQVARLGDVRVFRLLLRYAAARVIRRDHVRPQLAEGVHVERQVIQNALVVGNRRIDVMVELAELLHIVPHPLIGSVENVCAIPVHVDVRHPLSIAVAADMVALLNHQAAFALFGRLMCEHAAVQPRTHNQIIVSHNQLLISFSIS